MQCKSQVPTFFFDTFALFEQCVKVEKFKTKISKDAEYKFNISGNNQTTNIRLVNIICNYLNKKIKKKPKNILKFNQLIEFVKDRPGHDKKYFLNSRKIYRVINWKPKQKINKGLENTINWYLKNIKWWKKKS